MNYNILTAIDIRIDLEQYISDTKELFIIKNITLSTKRLDLYKIGDTLSWGDKTFEITSIINDTALFTEQVTNTITNEFKKFSQQYEKEITDLI